MIIWWSLSSDTWTQWNLFFLFRFVFWYLKRNENVWNYREHYCWSIVMKMPTKGETYLNRGEYDPIWCAAEQFKWIRWFSSVWTRIWGGWSNVKLILSGSVPPQRQNMIQMLSLVSHSFRFLSQLSIFVWPRELISQRLYSRDLVAWLAAQHAPRAQRFLIKLLHFCLIVTISLTLPIISFTYY